MSDFPRSLTHSPGERGLPSEQAKTDWLDNELLKRGRERYERRHWRGDGEAGSPDSCRPVRRPMLRCLTVTGTDYADDRRRRPAPPAVIDRVTAATDTSKRRGRAAIARDPLTDLGERMTKPLSASGSSPRLPCRSGRQKSAPCTTL